jgi:hypothetical protein
MICTFGHGRDRVQVGPAEGPGESGKHGVSFAEGATAFYDENGLLLDDPEHSEGEDRFIMLGLSSTLRLLVVVHCYVARMLSYASSRHVGQLEPSP